MTNFKWERTGNRWQVFDAEGNVIWDLTQDGNTNSDKQQAKKEMKIFLKLIKKKPKKNPDEKGTETDD